MPDELPDKSPTELRKHVYDVDLKEIGTLLKSKIKSNSKNKKAFAQLYKGFQIAFASYCNDKNIDPSQFYITIEAGQSGFTYYLSLFLLLSNPVKIDDILNHFLEKAADHKEFLSLIEFEVEYIIEHNFKFEQNRTLRRVTAWRRSKQVRVISTAPKSSIEREAVKLRWMQTLDVLKSLSISLFDAEYTERKTHFRDSIRQGKIITWKKDFNCLTYLLYQLYKKKIIKASRGKGYLKPATRFYQFSGKLVNEDAFHSSLYNVRTRFPEKYKSLRERVDEFIEDALKANRPKP